MTNPNVSAISDAVKKAANNVAIARQAAESLARQLADAKVSKPTIEGK